MRMRAAYLAAPGRVEVGSFPVPTPGPGQVLVRMSHAAVCGSDVHVVFGGMHDPAQLGRPGYPGHEGIGTIVAGQVPDLPPGSVVLTVPLGGHGGCFSEYQPVDAAQVIAVPGDGDPRRMLMAQQLGTTVYALRSFLDGPVPGSAVIIGAGSAGLFFLQQLVARAVSTVIVSDLDHHRRQLAHRMGATAVVPADTESVVDAARDLTAGVGADLVIEAAGHDRTRADAVEAARDRGTVGLFGYPDRTGLSPFPVERAFRKSLSIRFVNGTQREPGLRSFREALAMITTGAIDVEHCLGGFFPLAQAAAALAAARDHGRGRAKIGIELTGGVA